MKLNASTAEDEYSQFHDHIYNVLRDDVIRDRITHLTKEPVDIKAKVQEKSKQEYMKYCLNERCHCENDPSFQYCRVCRSKDLGKKAFTIDDVKGSTKLGDCM